LVVLPPRKGHGDVLAFFVFIVLVVVALGAGAVYDVVLLDGQQAPFVVALLAVMIMPTIGLWFGFKMSGFVYIDGTRGLSRPLWFRRKNPRIMALSELVSFYRIVSLLDRKAVVGVGLRLATRHTVVYHEKKTPGSTKAIVQLMLGAGVREEDPRLQGR
jgi:Zn-dependent protease with chaperone function